MNDVQAYRSAAEEGLRRELETTKRSLERMRRCRPALFAAGGVTAITGCVGLITFAAGGPAFLSMGIAVTALVAIWFIVLLLLDVSS